jgi:hypothetical protein
LLPSPALDSTTDNLQNFAACFFALLLVMPLRPYLLQSPLYETMPTTQFQPTLLLLCLLASALPKVFAQGGVQSISDCPLSNRTSCAAVDSKLPSDFCCPDGTSCKSFDSSSSALCCQHGSDCSTIDTISCNVTLQDVTKNASAMVMTTRLNDSLGDCGVWGCCPFGYQYHWRDISTCECQLLDEPAVTVTQVVSQNASASSSIIIPTTSNMTLLSSSVVTPLIDPSSSAAGATVSASESVGAATPTLSIANDPPKEKDPLPKGAVAGISVACTGIGLGGAILILIFCNRR